MRRALVLAVFAAALAAPDARAQSAACTLTWDGSASAAWSDPANWAEDRAPNATDVVCVPDGAELTVADVAITVAEVRSAGRPLRTTGALTIDGTATSALGALDITYTGALTGTAPVDIGSVTITTDGLLGGSGVKRVSGAMTTTGGILGRDARLETAGATTISYPPYSPLGYQPFGARKGSVWTNSGTMRFDDNLAPWGGFDTVPGPEPKLVNAPGGILEVVNRDRPYLGTELVNDGTIRGTGSSFQLRIYGGGTGGGIWGGIAVGGTFLLDDGARLEDLQVGGGTIGPRRGATITATGTQLLSGTLGGPGTLVVDGALTVNGGTLGVSGGRVLVPAGQTLDWPSNGAAIGDGARLETDGTVAFTPPSGQQAGMYFWGRGRWENRGTVELGRAFIGQDTNATSNFTILNNGLMRKTDPQASESDLLPYFRALLVNEGTIQVDRGLISFDREWRQSAGGRLRFDLRGPTEWGQIRDSLSGRFEAAGDIEVTRSNGYQPDDDVSFQVVSADLDGGFDRILGTDLGGGATLDATVSAFGVNLVTNRPAPRPAGAGVTPAAAAVAPAPLRAVGETLRVLRGRAFSVDPLVNDGAPAGSRIVLLSASRGIRARVKRSGGLRVRVTKRARRRSTIRYRFVTPSGQASAPARLRLRVVRT